MPSANQMIQFKYGLQSGYDGIGVKDVNTVYFTTDTQRLYVGDTEYSRPVQHGADMPEGYLPPNSLFVQETGNARTLYYSKDGASWEKICALPGQVSGGVFGTNTTTNLTFGSTFTVPQVTVNNDGFVTNATETTLTLPAAPEETDVSITDTGSGNAVTSITVEEDGRTLTVAKGQTFATSTELDAVKATAEGAMPTTGGTFTGPVYVQTPTENTNPATKLYVDTAIGNITDFGIDMHEGSGYATIEELEETHPEGEIGIFYLVVNPDTSTDNAYIEYFWTGEAYEMAGKFGSIDTSNFATKSDLSEGLNLKVDKTTTVNGQPLSRNVQIDNITGNAGSATKLETARKINGVAFDGTSDITIPTGPETLEDLTDTNIADPAESQALVYDGTHWINRALTKDDVGLSDVDNTPDSEKTVGSADKLTTARSITLTGDATGTTTFDGSANAIIATTVNHASSADSATKATQDGDGNVITTTYATKSEVTAATLVWQTF